MNYKLSPSDFSFLFERCKRCYYLKVVNNIHQPSIQLPAIFSKIAGLLKDYYKGKHTRKLHAALPPGIVNYSEKYVKSTNIHFSDLNVTCFISGRFDISLEFEDGTYGVIDFKTGNPNEKYYELYSRQLHAYAYALENAAMGKLSLSPIKKIGLLYFYPTGIAQQRIELLNYEAEIHWIEIKKDDQGFLKFIREVLYILEAPEPPEPCPTCQWCNYYNKLQNIANK